MSLNHLVTENPANPQLNVSVKTINNLTPVGGVFMAIDDANIITNTTQETNILDGATIVGTNMIKTNNFEISSYHANFSGPFNALGGGRTLTIKVRSNGALLAEFPAVQLTNAQGEFFEAELDFSIRSLGPAGVASISTNIDFTYSDSGAQTWRGERAVSVNNTTFDTTVDNELIFTVQFSDANPNLNIQCRQAYLHKVY